MRNWFARLFTSATPASVAAASAIPTAVAVAQLELTEFRSHAEYERHSRAHEAASHANWLLERSLVPQTAVSTLDGYCFVCKRQVPLLVDFLYGSEEDGVATPNWRERLVCPGCQLNNRMRAVVQIVAQECRPARTARIYITEQMTPLYNRLKLDYPALVGSEFLGEGMAPGASNEQGIRNEDLTRLSFADASLDFILSFDVFEHIPAFQTALAECCRSLRPAGRLVFSVPFIRNAEKNLVRATMAATGEVTHLLPPEYHGDPINAEGCLCFYHFGWQLLDDLHAAGFAEAHALTYWSREFGYLGGEQILFVATKAPAGN